MPDTEIRYRRPDEIVERDHLNQAGGGGAGGGAGGSSGGGSSGGGTGSGSGSSGANQGSEDPRYTGRGDSRNNQAHSQPYPQGHGQGMEQPNTSTGSQRTQNEQPRQQQGNQPNNYQGEQPKEQNPMTYCPPAFGFSAASPYGFGLPYAAPYGAYPAAAAPAGANVVVAGSHDGHNGTHSQLETLSDIALGGLRESAATGRTNQLSTQIAQLGERHSMEAGFSRELSTQREFTAAQKDRGDLEARLLSAIKDEAIRTREMFTNERIRSLETENVNLRDSRRFQELDNDLSEIKRILRERNA